MAGTEKTLVDEYCAQIGLRTKTEQYIIYAAARSIRATVKYAGELGRIAMTLVLLEQSVDAEATAPEGK